MPPYTQTFTTDQTLTEILDFPTRSAGMNIMFCFVDLVGSDFDQFEILAKTPNSGFKILYNTTMQFNSPSDFLILASGNLTKLSGGSTRWFLLNSSVFDHVQIKAASKMAAGSTGTVYTGSHP